MESVAYINNYIIEIIKKIDNPLILLVALLILGFSFIFKSNIIELFNRLKANLDGTNKSKILSLLNHDIFPTMTRVEREVANNKFYTNQKFDETKTRMCYDFTKHKVEQCAVRMKAVVEKKGIDSMNKNALKNYILEEQHYMHELYIKAIKEDWALKGIDKVDRDYVVLLFEKFRYDVVVSFENRINSIFSNEGYNDNYTLLLAVFEMWAMGIDLLPRDMSTTFEALNGRFKNLKYDYK